MKPLLFSASPTDTSKDTTEQFSQAFVSRYSRPIKTRICFPDATKCVKHASSYRALYTRSYLLVVSWHDLRLLEKNRQWIDRRAESKYVPLQ